jgi:hypothetical protein
LTLFFPRQGWGQGLPVSGIPLLAGEAEDRIRVAQLLGEEGAEGFLLRTPSALLDQALGRAGPGWSVTFLGPAIGTVWNSDLPFSLNDGPLWAGRGLNALVTAGVRVGFGPATLVLAPQFLRQENRPFQYVPYPGNADPPRDQYANPYHPLPESLDLPVRPGPDAISRFLPGQSSLTVAAGALSFGLATENAWWGPGIRNGILWSSQAEGVPRLFLRTSRPLETRAGAFEGSWILGRLQESDHFDLDPSNDRRTLSGLVVTFSPTFDRGLTLGLARMVYAPLAEGATGLGAGLDFLKSVGRPNQRPWDKPLDPWGAKEPLPQPDPAPDQISALFARWLFPAAGFEVYTEWARFEQPGGFRDFLEFPQHSQGYSVGLQWVDRKGETALLRVQSEFTNLEPSATWRHRNVASTYASRVVPQGYTHRGQVLGASIGPGSSSQWLALDWMEEFWRLGAFGGRIRWDAAAHHLDVVPQPKREDVSLFWGLRGGLDLWGWGVTTELTTGVRLNYLFQTFWADPVTGRAEGVDVANSTLSLTLSKPMTR